MNPTPRPVPWELDAKPALIAIATTPTNDVLIHDWDEWMRSEGLADKSRYESRYALLRFLCYITPPRPAAEVSESDVVVYLTVHVTRSQMRSQSIRALRSFFGWAHEAGHVPEDPTAVLSV